MYPHGIAQMVECLQDQMVAFIRYEFIKIVSCHLLTEVFHK